VPAGAWSAGPVVSAAAMAAIWAFMFHLGTTLDARDYRAAWREPALMVKALFCTLVAVPLVAVALARAFELPRAAQIGVVLMAIAPGAPIALRRALRAGGDTRFAVSLQATLAAACIVSMPLSVAAFDEVFAGKAAVDPLQLAWQVVLSQALPLALGLAARRLAPAAMERAEPALDALAGALMALLIVLALLEVWRPVMQAGARVAAAAAVICACALAIGHALGGPRAATRRALAVACGARNVGFALIVATMNGGSAAMVAAMLAYLVVAAVVVTPYVAWQRRRQGRGAAAAQNTNLA